MTNGKLATARAGAIAPEPFFAARLSPHRSMSQKSFSVLMAVLVGSSLAIGTGFWLAGAWPVMGFLGLDVLLVWFAFRISYHTAGAFEEVAVWPHDLVVRQVSATGRVCEHRFNPFWTRFVVRRHEEIGITEMELCARGRELRIGAFLNPDDRESFASAFAQALATVKRR